MVGEQRPNRLVVEGKDDKHTIIHLMRRHSVDWDADERAPFIRPAESVQMLLDSLTASVKSYERFGVVIDADVDVAGRWRSVRNRLSQIGLELPPTPSPEGVVADGITPGRRTGVWLMPDNTLSGNLEDFLATLVPADDACWPYAREAATEAKQRGAKFGDVDRLKAEIHTWLAWQQEPGVPFGTAVTACYLRHDSEVALRFVAWFRRLFFDE